MRGRDSKMTRALRRAKPGNESLRAFARRIAVMVTPDEAPGSKRAQFLTSAAARWIARKGIAA